METQSNAPVYSVIVGANCIRLSHDTGSFPYLRSRLFPPFKIQVHSHVNKTNRYLLEMGNGIRKWKPNQMHQFILTRPKKSLQI
jgi:hypothetical protein